MTTVQRRRPGAEPEPATGRQADGPVEIPFAAWRDIALRVKDQFGADHVSLTSAGVAFFGFAAIVPTLLVVVSLYGLFADVSDVTALVDRIEVAVPGAVADVVDQQLRSLVSSSARALGLTTVVGIVAALWSASSGMGHLVEAVNIAYNQDPDDRPFWYKRLLALAFTLGAVILVGTSALLVSFATRFGSGATAFAAQLLGWLIVGALAIVGLAFLYRFGPDRRTPKWRWVSPGALLAVAGWVAVSIGFSFYVSRFGSYNETYGSLGAILVVLTWLYLSATVVVVGAEVNAEIERQVESAPSARRSPSPEGSARR